jgi:hypothetical protein
LFYIELVDFASSIARGGCADLIPPELRPRLALAAARGLWRLWTEPGPLSCRRLAVRCQTLGRSVCLSTPGSPEGSVQQTGLAVGIAPDGALEFQAARPDSARRMGGARAGEHLRNQRPRCKFPLGRVRDRYLLLDFTLRRREGMSALKTGSCLSCLARRRMVRMEIAEQVLILEPSEILACCGQIDQRIRESRPRRAPTGGSGKSDSLDWRSGGCPPGLPVHFGPPRRPRRSGVFPASISAPPSSRSGKNGKESTPPPAPRDAVIRNRAF